MTRWTYILNKIAIIYHPEGQALLLQNSKLKFSSLLETSKELSLVTIKKLKQEDKLSYLKHRNSNTKI